MLVLVRRTARPPLIRVPRDATIAIDRSNRQICLTQMEERARATNKTMDKSRCEMVSRLYTREEVTALIAAGLMKANDGAASPMRRNGDATMRPWTEGGGAVAVRGSDCGRGDSDGSVASSTASAPPRMLARARPSTAHARLGGSRPNDSAHARSASELRSFGGYGGPGLGYCQYYSGGGAALGGVRGAEPENW